MITRVLLTAACAALCMAAQAKDVAVSTPASTLLLSANEGRPLTFRYYGSRLASNADAVQAGAFWQDAYPAFGNGNIGDAALIVRYPDGNMSADLALTADKQERDGNATVFTFTMKDKLYPLYVDVCYKAWDDCDIIETWTNIRWQGKKPMKLLRYLSASLPVRRGDTWWLHQHGSWGAEAETTIEPVTEGIKEVRDVNFPKNAVLNRPNIMLGLDGRPQENSGTVVGAVLCWAGNFRITVDTPDKRRHLLQAGICEDAAEYNLAPGATLATPHLALAYSREGMGGVSRAYHRWARAHGALHNGMAMRDILLNSWEGVYLNVSQKGMETMMDGEKEFGGELFVMDDGWFASAKYNRNRDNAALGDWTTDKAKLPQGVPALQAAAEQRGLKWGIWIEPEMTNTTSELYEKHPDWIVCHPTREPIKGRGGTQVILDMSNPRVQDFVFSVVDNIMTETPKTHYIKWDCNAEMRNFGSHYLTADRQSHLTVDYHLGLIKTMERIRAKYPKLVIQDCASGGGRVNYGLLPYFDEFWVSDNTDAEQRLFIQWGTGLFFPSNAMAQHVSASPNHQTGRALPLKFRFDVAFTGRLGMEMKPSDLSPQELQFAKEAVATYKRLRPTIQLGDLYRVLSPYDNKGYCSQLAVEQDKSHAVFFAYKFRQYINMMTPRFRFAGLDPAKTYRLAELNKPAGAKPASWEGKAFSGRFLMDEGIELSLPGVWDSKVIEATAN